MRVVKPLNQTASPATVESAAVGSFGHVRLSRYFLHDRLSHRLCLNGILGYSFVNHRISLRVSGPIIGTCSEMT